MYNNVFVFLWKFLRFLVVTWIPNKLLEWECTQTGEIEREQWKRSALWKIRPRYVGHIKYLDCGCGRRFGRIVLINGACTKHGFSWLADEELDVDQD